ncbi:hypothetical protein J3R82DRAFT_9314 [Butyriboletus roseoflavus]|nr:hypothetical protein J3R82DRAFT_9314 [Butyriboletus roseoflavus]
MEGNYDLERTWKEDDPRAGVGTQCGIGVHTQYAKNVLQQGDESAVEKTVLSKGRRSSLYESPPAPLVFKDEQPLKSDAVEGTYLTVPTRSGSYASTNSSLLVRDFILKSLTRVVHFVVSDAGV